MQEVSWCGRCQLRGPIKVEGPLVLQMWKNYVSSSYYFSSGHWMGPERGEQVAPRTSSTTADGAQEGRSSGLGPGHTLGI